MDPFSVKGEIDGLFRLDVIDNFLKDLSDLTHSKVLIIKKIQFHIYINLATIKINK